MTCDRLDPDGRVVRPRLGDGREVIDILGEESFVWQGQGIDFHGQVGCVVHQAGKPVIHRIDCDRLEVK
jgi:hypothetical protein